MIDETNAAIGHLEERIRRDNDRRYSFYRMLHATDLVLWRLEELNRDGVKTIPDPVRGAIQEQLAELPIRCKDVYRGSEAVQDALDSVFEIQERLFEWNGPARPDDDDLERLSG